MSKKTFVRPYAKQLISRLREPRRFLQIISGARQVGKTTMVTQVAESIGLPCRFASADVPTLRGTQWIEQQWEAARLLEAESGREGAVLILDEVQKVQHWAEMVKHLWDEDSRRQRKLKVVLLGSAPLALGRGLSESLAGRFELLHLPHWSFPEMREAFGLTLDQYVFYGAYPGAVPLMGDLDRWKRYIRDSLIETTVSREVLLLSRVDKPALLRRLLELGCAYSGQILSYTKMLGQLQDKGNTVTLAHYLDLLGAAGVLACLGKYAGAEVRRRNSIPKLQVFNTALMTATFPLTMEQALEDRQLWGRLVESAVGAHLVNAQVGGACRVFYWRERNREVDFVVREGDVLTAIEVKSGRTANSLPGMAVFERKFPLVRKLLVGGDGVPVGEFLSRPVEYWIGL